MVLQKKLLPMLISLMLELTLECRMFTLLGLEEVLWSNLRQTELVKLGLKVSAIKYKRHQNVLEEINLPQPI